MDAILNRIIDQLNSSVFVLIAIFIIVCYGLYRLGKLVEKFFHHEKKISNLESLSEKVIEIKTKIDLIYQNTNPNAMTKAMSPISLTPKGEEVKEKIKAEEIFAKYSLELKSKVAEINPKTAYDIQAASIKVSKDELIKMLDEKDLATIKNEAFFRGVIVEDILSIFGILLRNSILKEKGIPISEVDVGVKKT